MSKVERVFLMVENGGIGLTPESYHQMNRDIQNAIARSEHQFLGVMITLNDGYYIIELDSAPPSAATPEQVEV